MKRFKYFFPLALFSLSLLFLYPATASAAFNKDRLIDDEIFNIKNSMSASSIDAFLNKFTHSCISKNSGFQAKEPTGYSYETGYQYGSYASAGQVIYAAAQAYDINPKVLIVTLEKEQSLVTGRNSSTFCSSPSGGFSRQHKYAAAMGYACTDNIQTFNYSGISLYRRNGTTVTNTGDTCVESKAAAGFSQQIIRGAWLLKFGQQRSLGNIDWAIIRGSWDNSDDLQSCYSGPMTEGSHQVCPSGSVIYYDGYKTIDGTKTYMGTGATAALYWYTPHFHGNELFVSLFEEWFGPTTIEYNVVPVVYDNSTDTGGELASVGFKLTSKPNSSVSFLVHYDSTHASSAEYRITINPNNWNSPRRNMVLLKGKDSLSNTGSTTFELTTGKLTSLDHRFNLSSTLTPDVPILHQETSGEVYRLFNSSLNAHLFTSSASERDSLVSEGWRDEGVAFYGCEAGNIVIARLNKSSNYKLIRYGSADYDAHIANGFKLQSLAFTSSDQAKTVLYVKYRPSSKSMFYTTSETEGDSAGFELIGTMKVCNNAVKPVFRLYSPPAGNHFYTQSPSERNSAREKYGFRYEGVAFYLTNGGTIPVYRLFSSQQTNHFYTSSESEKASAVSHGFRYEGVAFKANSADTVNIYRLFSGAAGNHFYTIYNSEKTGAQAQGYRLEGAVGFPAY